MDLITWIPLTLAIGLGLFGICYLFLIACEQI